MAADTGYRRDIDGLRALAIVPVVLYHSGVPGVTGGYIGVDIFFVISGFLITGIIAREIDRGAFSIIHFYERRARRILPALLVMLAAVLAAASWLYLPGDFEGVPRSALMALLFLSNVWFFAKTGYFAGGGETMPLLHCWSLAVEEQFYIGFPILLWLVARFMPNRRCAVVAAVAAISFAMAWLTQAKTDGFAFYMLPPRAWELFVGALLALGVVPALTSRPWREIISLAGLGAVLAAIVCYDKNTIFPGVSALAPVLGAAALLHCAPGTVVGRLLSTRLPVAIGLISYSLYLWHWPLIVFVQYAREAPLSGGWTVGVILASLLLAWASWRFVERPFRSPAGFNRRQIFAASGVGMAALGAASLALVSAGGWASRFPPESARYVAAESDSSPARDICITNDIGGDRPQCNLGAAVRPTSLLWGDSHGVEMAWVLGERARADGRSLMERTRASCAPVLGYSPAKDPGCPRFNEEVMARIRATPALHRIYLAAFWESPAYRLPDTLNQLDRTIAALQAEGREVVLIGPVPAQPFNVPRHLAMLAAQRRPTDISGVALADYRADSHWLTASYGRWRAQGVRIVDPAVTLCDPTHCAIERHGVPLYFDSHHLSLTGARAVLAANRGA